MLNSPELEQIIENAVTIAKNKHHRYCLTEHMLLSMVRHEPFRKVLDSFGTPTDLLDTELDAYLNGMTSITGNGDKAETTTDRCS